MMQGEITRLSIFPLAGALLFPRSYLPLHIFEPRYRALVKDALARDRRIAMIQPRDEHGVPALFDVGCIGHIINVEALDDGRFNLVLEGRERFRVIDEIEATTPFRQIRAQTACFDDDKEPEPLASIVRAELEEECRRFAEAQEMEVDWETIGRIDDEAFVNGTAQVVPFDVASKQALLESPTIADRSELLIQFFQFARMQNEGRGPTLQ